jgi:ABC-type transport system substrate-binding protein
MDRRVFLESVAGAAALSAAGGFATPAISQRAAARTLHFVPHADLANFDPIWTNAYVARNAGLLVWDTLYGVDAQLQPRRQMVEAEEVSSDGLTWTFRLRPELKSARRSRGSDPTQFPMISGCARPLATVDRAGSSGVRKTRWGSSSLT